MLTDLVSGFPRLVDDGYNRTSLPTIAYNCVAWAFGDQTKWWEPDVFGLFHWPCAERQYTVQAYEALAKSQGYKKCSNGDLEPGFDKIAIYAANNQPKHIARQLQDGRWTSKLGDLDDITHTLSGIKAPGYGEPVRFLKRPKP